MKGKRPAFTAPGRRGEGGPEPDAAAIRGFRRRVWHHFRTRGRKFPWRETRDPYAILVSEYMLQQTQVARVAEKFPAFLATFPDIATLAAAPLRGVLSAWQGLGYNRRAVALHRAATLLVAEHGGRVPDDRDALLALPGVGPSTAGGILAFAFNRPVILLETNIRRVFLHHFFPGREPVPDREILPLVEATMDRNHPREWYWALMDLGSDLRRLPVNPNLRSPAYRPQSPFHGSDRQIRGRLLRVLIRDGILEYQEAVETTGCTADRLDRILAEMEADGFLERTQGGAIRIREAGSRWETPSPRPGNRIRDRVASSRTLQGD